MARRFQNGDKIVFPIPAALQVDGGPLTILLVAKVNTSTYQAAIYTRSSGAHAWWCEYDTTGGLHLNYGTGTTARPIGSVSTGAWMINTARKDNAGSVQPIGRHLTGAGFTTDSGDVTAASTLIDGTAADGSLGLQFGLWGTTTDDSDDLELAFAAIWTSLVSGATLATLTTEALVLAASPTYWASFEGSGTPTDSVGGTPTVTNTTTTADPSGFFGGATVTGTAAAALGGLTGAAAGTPTTFGAAAVTLSSLAASAAGVRTVFGVAASALGGLAATSAGTSTTFGTAASTLGGAVASVSGVRTVLGVAAAALGGLSGAATVGASTKTGTAAAALGALSGASAGTRTVGGTATAALGRVAAAVTTPVSGLIGEAHGPLPLAAGAVIVHTGTIAGAVT